jgi:hypothetical protein
MIIGKTQGQSLKEVGIDVSEECFSHGQLHVACSEVFLQKAYTYWPTGNTPNVVYKEVLC